MVASLISQLKLRLTEEAATLFISRIYSDTNNLTSSSVSANTMETLGYLMQHGGKFSSSSLLSTPPLQSVSAPVFSSTPANLDVSIPDNKELSPLPSKIPSEWKKPKIYSSSSKQKKS